MAGLGGNTDPLNLVEVELEVGVFETTINPKLPNLSFNLNYNLVESLS